MIKTSLPWWNLKTRHLRVVVFFLHILHINENILQLPLVIVPNQKHLKFVKKIIIEEKKIRVVEILVPELLLRQVVLNWNISVISSSRFFFFWVAIRINSYFYLIITAICLSEHRRFHWQLTTVWKHREGRGGYKSGNCHAV